MFVTKLNALQRGRENIVWELSVNLFPERYFFVKRFWNYYTRKADTDLNLFQEFNYLFSMKL